MPNSEGNLHLRTGLKLAMSNEQGVSPMQLALKASFIQQTIQTYQVCFQPVEEVVICRFSQEERFHHSPTAGPVVVFTGLTPNSNVKPFDQI